ncbi:DUF7860 family protein [Halocatena salina]|uniref:Uncharacterized protein n=1 Tax=Halocatena salina TaxID=2934340 RepID=A0A8U0A321_9EURY|nr:hypothetical protein [Halocatena salina]UPM43570.1 hypothetical protein MW046_03765 [Halocatena salina]
MGRYGDLDYGLLTKTGFLLGIGLFALGAGGGAIGHSLYGTLPAWETTLFTYAEVVGILLGLFSPFLFGIFLPLTE